VWKSVGLHRRRGNTTKKAAEGSRGKRGGGGRELTKGPRKPIEMIALDGPPGKKKSSGKKKQEVGKCGRRQHGNIVAFNGAPYSGKHGRKSGGPPCVGGGRF